MADIERYWIKHYPDGIPADIDLSGYRSLLSILHECIADNIDKPAYYHMGSELSYQEVGQLSQRFSSALRQQFGIKKGDRIALMVPNILAHPVVMFGILRAGATVVNINPLYTARELTHLLNDASVRMIIIMDKFNKTLSDALGQIDVEHICSVTMGDLHPSPRRLLLNLGATLFMGFSKNIQGTHKFNQVMSKQASLQPDCELEQDDIAFLQYTGGTTGVSKGAILSHGNVLANCIQAHTWISPVFSIKNPHVITALPLYHVFALQANCFVLLKLGACSHLITNPRDMKRFLKCIAKKPFHAITGVNTLFNAMMRHPGFKQVDFSELELALAGGMAVMQSTAIEWQKATGRPIIQAYGLTESSPAITANPTNAEEFSGSIGLPLPSTEVTIRDDKDNILDIGEEGELWARGPQVMKGYWNMPEETALTLTDDGWLKTGDIAMMDDRGYVTLIDRKKDMIIVSGFNVYPNEVEDILTLHPDIDEAGVIGIDDEMTGEKVKAVIVCHHNKPDKEAIIRHCRKHLTAYKVPKIIEYRDNLPKTSVGKILRRALR